MKQALSRVWAIGVAGFSFGRSCDGKRCASHATQTLEHRGGGFGICHNLCPCRCLTDQNRKGDFTVLGMSFFFSFFGSVHFYWVAATNKVFCYHTKSRDGKKATQVPCISLKSRSSQDRDPTESQPSPARSRVSHARGVLSCQFQEEEPAENPSPVPRRESCRHLL